MEIPTDLASGFQDPKPVSTPSPSLAPQAMPTPQSNVEELAQYGLLDIQRQIAERKRIEASRFQQAIAGDPNMEARKVQIAQELGIDPADPTQDWKIAEQFARQREVERQAFDEKYPLVAAQMRNFDFVAQAYDDIGHLQQIEKIGNFTKGRYMVERGYIGAQLASGIGDARLLRDRLAQIDSSINAVPPLEGVWDSITGGTAEMLGQMSKTMPAAVAAGAAMAAPGLVAGPAAPISSGTLFTAGFLGAQGAQTAIIEGGNAYLDYIQAGMGEAEAKQAASVVGIVNGALETVLGKYALKPFTAAAAKVGPRLAPKVFKPIGKETVAAGFAKSYFAGLGGEIATEIGQEISQIVGEEWGMSVSRPELEQRISTPEGRQQIYDQIGEIASKTFYSMLVLGLPGPLANMAADARRVEQAQTDTAIIKAIATGAQDSKLAERNPELARQFSAEAKGVEEVFITADALRSLLNGIDEQATAEGKVQKSAIDMLRELLPDVVRQLEDATTDKDSIVIKTEDLQVSLRNTEMQSKMLPHLRIDKNGMSEAEAQKYEPNLKAMAQSAKQAISEKAQKDQQFREQLRAIRENQTAQIQAAGRSLSEARIGGHLYAQMMALMNAEVNAKLAAQGKEPIALADFERVYGMSTRAGVPMSENAIEASRVLGKFEVKPVVQTPQEAAQAAPPTAPAQPAEAAVAPAPEAAVPPSQEAAPQAQPQQAPADPVAQAKELLASPPQEMTEQERGVLETFVKDSDQGLRSRLPGTVAQMDAEYLAAVERGDMETAQRMVDNVARSLGLIEAWHGTSRGLENDGETSEGVLPFSVFRPSRIGRFGPLIYLARSREVAEQYANISVHERMNSGRGAGTRKVLRVYVSNANPIVVSEGSDQTFWSQLPEGTDAQAVAAMQRLGFTGVIADEEMAVPNPQQIKSADAITYDASGNVIPLSQRFDLTKDSILFSRLPTTAAKLDAEYLAAVERGDMETAQRMVDEAAKTAGFTTKLWHGTTATVDVATGSTPADAQARKELNALVELLRAAGVYVGNDLSEVGYWVDRFIDEQPAKAAVVGITKSDSAKARSLVKASVGRRAVPEQKMSFDVFNFDTNNEFGPHFGTKQQAETFGNAFPFYVKISRALRLKDLGTWQAVKVLSAAKKAGVSISDSEMESVLALWDAPQDPSTPTESKADVAVRNLLKSKGYDAIVYKNTAEGEGDSYIAFAPSQIKSADPVTRDASGNVIPLSQRFDLTKDSILFSRLPTTAAKLDAEYLSAVARGDMETAQRMVDAAAKAAGFNRKAFHGSASKPFWVFDPAKRGQRTGANSALLGFFASSQRQVAEEYQLTESERKNYNQPTALVFGLEAAEENLSRKEDIVTSAVFDDEQNGWLAQLTEYDQWGAEFSYDNDFVYESKSEAIDAAEEYKNSEIAKAQQVVAKKLEQYESEARQLKASRTLHDLWVNLQNPLIYDFQGGSYKDQSYSELVQEAIDEGHDGVVMRNTVDSIDTQTASDVIVFFQSSQAKLADPVTRDASGNVIPLSQRFNLTKDSILYSQTDQGVGGTYDRMARQTVLNQNAQPTTYFHELMHFMFDSYATLIQQGLASDQMRKDMDTLTRDLGKLEGGFDEYAQLSPERQAQVHEAVAYSWESWLFSGEVPREDMRPIFSRITEFFVSTWKTLTAINETYKIESGGKDLPGMTPEVKEVFKRMVAARDQIRMAEATKAAVPLFLSKEQWVQYGGNADDWENYQQIERLRIEEAVASLGRKSLRSLGWLTRNHHDRLNAIRKIAENIRAGMYEEVQQEVERTRVERVRRFLATGEMMAEDGSISAEKAKNHKLSIDSVALDREKATAIMQPLDDAVAAAEAEQKLWEDMLLQELPLEPVKPAKPKPLPPAGTTERAVYNEAVEEHRKAMVAYAQEKSRIKSWNQKIRENREASSKAVTEAKRNQRGGLEQIAAMKKKARDAHPLASMLAEDGVSPHFLRDMFGYESAEAVLEDLLKAPSKEDAIMASIDAKMLAENSELSNPQQVEEAVNASLVNQFNTKWLVMELSALERATLGGQNTPAQMQEQQEAEREVIDLKNDLSVAEQTLRAAKESKDQSAIERAQESVNDLRAAIRDRQKVAEGKLPPRIMLAAARAAARMATQDKKISELRPDLHVGAARRHSREALQHLTDNDLPAALNSKRQQLLSDQMAREAEDVRAEVQSSRRWFARILKNKNRKDRSLDYVVAARAVLALFGVGSKAQVRRAAETAQQFLQQLQQYEPERFAEINRIIVEATANRKDFRDLTVEEFRRLKALVSELWQYAKDEKSVLLDGTRQQVEAIKTQIQERASKLAKPGARPGQLRKMTPLEGGIAWLRSRIAWMRRAESMFDEWDGKEPGIFTKTFWRPVQKAVLAYRSKRDQYHKRFNDILDKVRPSMKWKPIHSKELNYTFSNTAELMGFLMHLGNESNAAKHIAAGRGAGHQWGTVNEATGAVDETRVWKAINDLIAEGELTQEHVDAVQEVWNLTADLKPQIQKVYRQKWGEFFHEVPARSFTLTFNDGTTKTYAGGYVPAKVDNDLVADYGDPSSLASVDQEFKDSMPTTGWGFTIKRYEEYRKPLDMDLSRIAQHIEHTMRFVEIQPQLWALSRLLKNEEIKTAINSIDPDALKQVIFPWLSRVASQRTGVRGGDSATDRLLRLTRNRAGMMVMFGNISNTLQQITGVFPALLKVKKSYLFASARRFLSSKKGEFAAWVASKSVFMDQRLRSQIFVLQEHMNDILVNPSKLDKARQFATKNAYIFQATVQNRLDVIIWSAAYEQAMAEKPSGTSELDWEKEAVARADAAVNLTQGSTQPEAISAAESGTEFVRLFTQFTSYFNMLFNLNRAEVKKLTQDGGWSSNKWPLFYTFMMGYAVPSVTAAIIAQAIGGKLDDEDDDGYMDEAGIIMLKGLVSGGLSMVPIAGQSIAALTINRFDEVTYNDRMLSNPAIGAIEKAFGGGYQLLDAAVSEDKDATGRKVRDALILFDMIAGIPVSQTFSKLAMGVNVLTGEQPTYGAVDAARAFVTGTPAEGLRQR